jgi:hypothetical protein
LPHVFVLVSQMGFVGSAQSLSARHCTQALVSVLHTWPLQVVLSVHATHLPAWAPLATQAGVVASLALHSAGLAHARQVLLLQIGVVSPQSLWPRHCTHRLVLVLHIDFLPVQALASFSVHSTHDPPAAHAGAFGSLSLQVLVAVAQPLHTLPSQMGVAPLQFWWLRHPTHVLVVGSQLGLLGSLQSTLPLHSTHDPVSQIGVPGSRLLHWLLTTHLPHTPPLQMGVPDGQARLAVQPTQV